MVVILDFQLYSNNARRNQRKIMVSVHPAKLIHLEMSSEPCIWTSSRPRAHRDICAKINSSDFYGFLLSFPFLIKNIYQLRDIWAEEISKGQGQIDVLSWLSKMTLDVIGLAGLFISFVPLSLPCKPMPRL